MADDCWICGWTLYWHLRFICNKKVDKPLFLLVMDLYLYNLIVRAFRDRFALSNSVAPKLVDNNSVISLLNVWGLLGWSLIDNVSSCYWHKSCKLNSCVVKNVSSGMCWVTSLYFGYGPIMNEEDLTKYMVNGQNSM